MLLLRHALIQKQLFELGKLHTNIWLKLSKLISREKITYKLIVIERGAELHLRVDFLK